jgi:hypothetical protein
LKGTRLFTAELLVTQTKLKAELRHDYRAHLPTKDGDELIRSYMPPAGMRYRHFVHELAAPIFKSFKASGPVIYIQNTKFED